MPRATLRKIAGEMGLSIATLSRALHDDPRVRPDTRDRVRRKLREAGYEVDPVVSAGMSRIRRGSFYRETLAWCGSLPPRRMPWLGEFFRAAESFGASLGYRLEYFHFVRPEAAEIRRLASIWRARGIRGVLLGPFHERFGNLALPWEDFAWVVIGRAVEDPVLHSVGRDYDADIATGLAWLQSRGCRRPAFLLDPAVGHLFREPFLRAALRRCRHGRPPIHELDAAQAPRFREWCATDRPDGLLLSGPLPPALHRLVRSAGPLPTVLLSPPEGTIGRDTAFFSARFAEIGRSCISLLHRLLFEGNLGVPAYKESVVISSRFSAGRAGFDPGVVRQP